MDRMVASVEGYDIRLTLLRSDDGMRKLMTDRFDAAFVGDTSGLGQAVEFASVLGGRSGPTPLVLVTETGEADKCSAALAAGFIDIVDIRSADDRVIERILRHIRTTDKMERAMRAAIKRERLANQARIEMFTRLGHDLRSPLNAIIGFAEVIETQAYGVDAQSTYLEYASDIAEAARGLNAMIEEAMVMSTTEIDRNAIELRPVDLANLAAKTVRLFEAPAAEKAIVLTWAAPDSAIWAKADNRAVSRILSNLVGNAIKFTPAGGDVGILLEKSDARVVMIVKDTGPGMSNEHLLRAHEPFFQGHMGDDPTRTGYGLGLAIVKSLSDALGASFNLSNADDGGLVARVEFSEAAAFGDLAKAV